MKMINTGICVIMLALGSQSALADVACGAITTCVTRDGLVEQAGLDTGGVYHVYSSLFPNASPTDPYFYVKITASNIGVGLSTCAVGNDSVIGIAQYNSDVRKSIYATALAAKTSGQNVQLTINDSGTCEIAAVVAQP